VKDRNFSTLGWNHRQATVGITQHQHGLGLNVSQDFVDGNDQVADSVSRATATFLEFLLRIT
jgi:hypothetical protein